MSLNAASAGTFAMTDSIDATFDGCAPCARRDVEWRTRYDGIVAVAHINDRAVAGISGPWSGKFALTWWERPLPARQLELFDSLEDAKREVETWALRMRSGYPSGLPGTTAQADARVAKAGLIDQMRALLPDFSRKRTRPSPRENIERMRHEHACNDADPGDLHFAAYESPSDPLH
jgi:hypothetical protein